jgi:ribA/ribD-fused uncharacterized protein
MSIRFWGSKDREDSEGKYYWCSNFYVAPIEDDDGLTYKTTEHYYQAHKFPVGSESFEKVRTAKSARECADLGRTLPVDDIKKWDEVKDDVMRQALEYKFTQHQDLFEQLMSTGNEEIIEASPMDGYWGWGPDHNGRNQLGKELMELREKYREQK